MTQVFLIHEFCAEFCKDFLWHTRFPFSSYIMVWGMQLFQNDVKGPSQLARLIPPHSLRAIKHWRGKGTNASPTIFFADQVTLSKPGGRLLCPTHYYLPSGFSDMPLTLLSLSLFHSVITNTNWLSVNCPTNLHAAHCNQDFPRTVLCS